jgi:hypothetical protein
MYRWLVIAVAVVGLAGAAVFSHYASGVQSGNVREAAAKLDGVPRAFGDWTSTDLAMDDKVLRVAEAAGHVSRVYANRRNKEWRLSVLLLCGPTGPIGAHEPKYCYAGSGFDMSGRPQQKAVALPGGASVSYWSALFEKKSGPVEFPQRVCWMWGVDGDWRAAEDPRTEYALRRALYKLYVTRVEPRAAPAAETADAPADPIAAFLPEFLSEVNKALAALPAAP